MSTIALNRLNTLQWSALHRQTFGGISLNYLDTAFVIKQQFKRFFMWRLTWQRFIRRLQLRDSWIIFFILGNVMINFPFLKIFNQTRCIMGLPVLFIYFTFGWAVSIGVIYLFTRPLHPDDKHTEEKQQL